MHRQRANRFITEHTPLRDNAASNASIRCPSAALLARFFLRNSIPLLLGVAAGVGTNWLEENNSSLSQHISDVVSCVTTLTIAYGMDWILEKYWPTNPYSPGQSIFSELKPNLVNTNINEGPTRCVAV